MKKLTALIILDGFGYSERVEGNAVRAAKMTAFPQLTQKYPHTLLDASEQAVGLPAGQMGNSEVGHFFIGAGRMAALAQSDIDVAIINGEFAKNPAFVGAVENCKRHGTALHLMGLCSHGGVHSNQEHLYELLKLAKNSGLTKVYVHCFTDGRDTAPKSADGFILELEGKIKDIGCGQIASVCGRSTVMDRDCQYAKLLQGAYNMLVFGEGERYASAYEAIMSSYENGVTDEYIKPSIIGEPHCISEHDSVIFFNFRADRAREITRALLLDDDVFAPEGFVRKKGVFPLYYATMTSYGEEFRGKLSVAFEQKHLNNMLGEYVSNNGMTQLRIAESQKYAHVTFFFNGGEETMYRSEDRALIPSPPNMTDFSERPEMSAYAVTEECQRRISSGVYDFIVLNFANPDMVGHSGNFEATVRAIEVVDECLGRIVDEIRNLGGDCLIIADHGNCEQMIDPVTGEPFTAHTTAKVPCVLVSDKHLSCKLAEGGSLRDVAPTVLELLGLDKPEEMTGNSLIIHN